MAGRKQATMASAAAVALLLAMAAVSGAGAAPGPLMMCNVDVYRMIGACRSYCARGSWEATPSGQCCAALRGANLRCVCQNKGLLASAGNIDARRAMQIPSKCGIGNVPSRC
ncbi:uncharacterized protein [Aegilops tauschii subsp. strangulata]|uniref:Bifunctional inhibitor/plant lipid transfer protein/seed storage helical domain-containing protein n=1 Tax=Aegilops tauschii subsp. strangulata TaxID=200361 RepID=A0A453GA02_AEGTS|nr:male-cone protein 1 [Aegilops tauschii subsp. strangulata]